MKKICLAMTPLFFFLLTTTGLADDEKPKITLGQEVNLAIRKGVEFIKSKQKPEGCFSNPEDQYADGEAALCMLAMLKSGVHHTDPAIQNILKLLKYRSFTKTYSSAVRIMACEALGDRDQIPSMHAAAQWLLDHFREEDGAWAYPESGSDLSNTQYAVLGLWSAERKGFEIPKNIWPALSRGVMEHQSDNGGFGYHPRGQSTGSMTTAGLFVLTICKDRIEKDRELKSQVEETLKRGWAYMERRFSPRGNPKGNIIFSRDRFFYYLYGLERSCALDNRKTLNGVDWYKESAKELVNCQKDDGSWAGIRETCFALLFLRKSTFTSMNKTHESNLDEVRKRRGNEKFKPTPSVSYLRNWLVLGPFENKGEAAFNSDLIEETRITPKSGKATKKIKWVSHRSMGKYVRLDEVCSKGRFIAYAFTYLNVREETDAMIWFGSDDGAKIFLDGKEIFNNPFQCGEGTDAHFLPIRLSEGKHTILVKVMQIDGNWRFAMRICDREGNPIPGLISQTDPNKASPQEIFDSLSAALSPYELFQLIPLDRKPSLLFQSKDNMERFFVEGNDHDKPMEHYTLIKRKKKRSGKISSALTFRVKDQQNPVLFVRRIKVPSKRFSAVARLAVLPHNKKNDHDTDFFVSLGVFDPEEGPEGEIHWLEKKLATSQSAEFPDSWQEFRANLTSYSGQEVLIFLECSAGGSFKNDWWRERGCLDEFSVVPGR